MTEDEAKTKWCPFANQGAVSAFRIISAQGTGSGAHTLCIGSACMVWRDRSPEPMDLVAIHVDPTDPSHGLMTVHRESAQINKWPILSDPVPAGTGFCGLAGAPA